MKKVNLFIIIVLSLFASSIVSGSEFKNEGNSNPQGIRVENVKIRHSAGQGNQCIGCKCPLGICLIIGIQDGSIPLTQAEIDEGYVTGTVNIILGKVNIVWDGPVALNGTLPVEANFNLDANVATQLGYASINVLSGTYVVDFAGHPYGMVNLDCILQ